MGLGRYVGVEIWWHDRMGWDGSHCAALEASMGFYVDGH